MDLVNDKIIKINSDYSFGDFDCGDKDLNEFLTADSIPHSNQLLATTYIIEKDNRIVLYYSLLNDKIIATEIPDKKLKKQILGMIPYPKRNYKSFPAMKIGRLAISKDFQGNKYGTQILDYLKILFITNNRTGCRFITVDAYKESIPFYEKNGFKFLTNKDEHLDTRQMFFDLIQIFNTPELKYLFNQN